MFGERKYLVCGGEENGVSKGGKYLIRGNIWSVEKKEKEENMWRKKYLISRGDEKRRRKRGKYLKRGIFWSVKEEKNVELKGGKHLEKEIVF